MRTEELFAKRHMILGEPSKKTIEDTLLIRPYPHGVVIHANIVGNSVVFYFDGTTEGIYSDAAKKLGEYVGRAFPDGLYTFLWHKGAGITSHSGVSKAKEAFLNSTKRDGFKLTPIKCNHGVGYNKPYYKFFEKHCNALPVYIQPFKSLEVKRPSDLTKMSDKFYAQGYGSVVVRAAGHNYRLVQRFEETFTIVDTYDSKRYMEIGGLIVRGQTGERTYKVHKGIERHDKQDIYRNPELYQNAKVVIIHDGLTTLNTLRNAKVKSITCLNFV